MHKEDVFTDSLRVEATESGTRVRNLWDESFFLHIFSFWHKLKKFQTLAKMRNNFLASRFCKNFGNFSWKRFQLGETRFGLEFFERKFPSHLHLNAFVRMNVCAMTFGRLARTSTWQFVNLSVGQLLFCQLYTSLQLQRVDEVGVV